MNIYYWKVKKNFGDLLTPLLVKRFLHLPTTWTSPVYADLVMVGSILHHLPKSFTGIIAGCGKLRETDIVNFTDAKILALRGPLTAKGVVGDFVLSDPGLIANELVGYQDKKWELGIVPHWTDTQLEHNEIFLKYKPKIIRVGDDPLKVIKEIGSCKKIVSSSLHGIILADAFGIPRRIEIPTSVLTNSYEGGVFKWKDYSASIGMKFEVGITKEADQNIITSRQHELFDLFEEIKRFF